MSIPLPSCCCTGHTSLEGSEPRAQCSHSAATTESWRSPELSSWQQLLLAAAFSEPRGTRKTAEPPLHFSFCLFLKPELQTQTCPTLVEAAFPSPSAAMQVTGAGSHSSKHSLLGAVVQPQAWDGCNLPRTLPERKAAQCSVCSRCQEERSLDTSRQLSQENKLSALSASPLATCFLLLLLLPRAPGRDVPQPPRPRQGGDRAMQAVLTDAVTQGRPVEAGLAAHDTAVGAQAVLAPPRAADGIPVFLTLIHVCREQGKGTGTVKRSPCLLTAEPGSGSVCQRPPALAGPPYEASLGAGSLHCLLPGRIRPPTSQGLISPMMSSHLRSRQSPGSV